MKIRSQKEEVKRQNRRGHSFCLLTFAFCLLFVLVVSPVHAQTPPQTPPEDQMYQIAKQLNCPTCAGRNLADCPTDTCTQWKQEIVSQLQAGKSGDEVLAYFRARFGDQVLQEPPKEGFTLLMWVVPVVAAAVLILIAIWVARRAATRSTSAVASGPSSSTTAGPVNASTNVSTNAYESELEQQVKDVS